MSGEDIAFNVEAIPKIEELLIDALYESGRRHWETPKKLAEDFGGEFSEEEIDKHLKRMRDEKKVNHYSEAGGYKLTVKFYELLQEGVAEAEERERQEQLDNGITSEDLRRTLLDEMTLLRAGQVTVQRAAGVAKLAHEIMQTVAMELSVSQHAEKTNQIPGAVLLTGEAQALIEHDEQPATEEQP